MILRQRRENLCVQRLCNAEQVIDQQGFCIGLRDLRALTRRLDMAMADHPAPVRKLDSPFAITFEPLDQLDGGTGRSMARQHAF